MNRNVLNVIYTNLNNILSHQFFLILIKNINTTTMVTTRITVADMRTHEQIRKRQKFSTLNSLYSKHFS